MSFEGELKSHYLEVRSRLRNPVIIAKLIPKPIPPTPPKPELCKLSTDKFRSKVSLTNLQRYIAFYCGVTVEELCGPRRHKRLIRARFIFYYLARKYTSAGMPRIGKAIGGRDHTTVLSGARRANHLVWYDDVFRVQLATVEKHVNDVDSVDKTNMCPHCGGRLG